MANSAIADTIRDPKVACAWDCWTISKGWRLTAVVRHDHTLRILITRLSHIGDCILTIPILNALRAHLPKAFIAWVIEAPAAPLLRGHQSLDELIVVPRGWLKSPKTVWNIRQNLRRLNCHVAIDPQGLTKSALLAWLSGARTRIGFAGSEGRELSRYLNNRLQPASLPHVVDRSLELLRPLGIESPEVHFRIPINLGAASYAEDFLREHGLSSGYAIINPGAGWNSRLWPPKRFGAVAEYLGQQRSLRSVAVWAGEQEQHWAQEIVAASGGYALLAPKTSLLELGALLERARLFVGSDTGPMHLSVAVGTRCVSLHGPTPAWQSGPYGEGHVAVQEVYHRGSSRQRRSAGNESMLAISVERVCDACDRVLAGIGDFGAEKQAA